MQATHISVLEGSSQPAAGTSDRRRSPRQNFVGNGWLSPEAGTQGPNHLIVVGDLSLHGIGFSSDEKLEPEAVHWMILDAGGLRASARVRISTCRPNPNSPGAYECGAEFF